ncbi:MAG: DUF393 domain-containing protein [Methylococcaceae bacterium]|nr:DUF393 domain-containing protein [Methylococcaceae bacterium]MDD1616696.1 DUF393 domain-containing protein [Methylococcaceae bacterium]OYV17071.1 MAG: thiol-disulfide oxidoreductase DCC [Methylococcaceae bacterium NSP1-2]
MDKQKIEVYYNSACPVCNAGIESQKGKMKDCSIDWKDVHSDYSLVNNIDSELEFVRERLHLVNAEGKLLVGFDAFLEIWRHSPKEQGKVKFFGLPIIRQISTIFYNTFAAVLYKWNKAKKHW